VQIFLVRHADAMEGELADRDRHLTPAGRIQARALGERLRWHDCSPSIAFTSPLVRAVQTAELVLAGRKCERVEVLPELAHGGDPHAVVAAVRAQHGTGVLVVGHAPSIAVIGGLLVGDPAFRQLARAEAVRIVDGAVRWRFRWDADAPERP
jgi:phosphohistidine phosphatase